MQPMYCAVSLLRSYKASAQLLFTCGMDLCFISAKNTKLLKEKPGILCGLECVCACVIHCMHVCVWVMCT